jgi:hypothetical protein
MDQGLIDLMKENTTRIRREGPFWEVMLYFYKYANKDFK